MAKYKGELSKKIVAAVVSVLIIVALIYLITWSPTPEQPPLKTYTVMQQDVEDRLEVTGMVVTRTLDDEEQKAVQLFVDESDIVNVKVDAEVTVVFTALNDEEFTGTIDSTSDQPRITGDVTEYEVIVQLEDQLEDIRNGMHADVSMVLSNVEDVIAVPAESIYTKDDIYYVDIVHEQTRVNLSRLGINKAVQTTEPREVTVGLEGNEYVEITEGVEEGDLVIME
jgi:multidrug efflux pump subunit AcrA (membrane-fusion protein)